MEHTLSFAIFDDLLPCYGPVHIPISDMNNIGYDIHSLVETLGESDQGDRSGYFNSTFFNISWIVQDLKTDKYFVVNHYDKYYVIAFAIDYARFKIHSRGCDKKMIDWKVNVRTTTIHAQSLTDPVAVKEEYDNICPDGKFITLLEEKYKTEFNWTFAYNGGIEYECKYNHMNGEVDDNVKMLLEVAKEYKRPITGTFMYHDYQIGSSSKGIVHIFGTQAIINEFNANVLDISEMNNALILRTLNV